MTLVDRYLACWNETDPEARAKAVAELWTEDGTYTDPLADVTGHAAIAAVIEGAQSMFPGLVFTPGRAVRQPPPRRPLHLAPRPGGRRPRRHRLRRGGTGRGRPRPQRPGLPGRDPVLTALATTSGSLPEVVESSPGRPPLN
ncbi:nuclear transport factor 2 family protein [Nonomuraea salmonea]|uniref:nuclear transport factor 2 family protein n=1 Tax=Nonomuraea salmonea TaxID=46181 RepID=UPI002FE8150E